TTTMMTIRIAAIGAMSTLVLLAAACSGTEGEVASESGDSVTGTNNLRVFDNAFGQTETYTKNGAFDLKNPFFQSLGTNGRTCGNCHDPTANWTITPTGVQVRFDTTSGTDPLFRTVDGSNSPNADVSTVSTRRTAYSMLLSKGLIRVGMGIPAGA